MGTLSTDRYEGYIHKLMPKRTDIKKILLIGSGPIIIGQACEFDYSGTQACKALKEEGYEVILINSNPATIMTDPELADRTYIEPVTTEMAKLVIERDRPDALLPTIGGQTGLNTALSLADLGVLDSYGVRLIGANVDAIRKAEDRLLFKKAMKNIGQKVLPSGYAKTYTEAREIVTQTGFPAIIRPSYTLGGTGASIAYSTEDFEPLIEWGLKASPTGEILIEKSIIGWKEFELEVMRDTNDNVVIICSIENFDPMGVHTGDSITVAPAQTLTDREYQIMRDAAIDIIREIGVDTGGSNIQFATNPKNGEMIVIEMNPRVSRSSALASKATGFPIAKIAAKLAIGLTLDEISNDITKKTPASFEPTLDYCVVKVPRFTFEKFYKSDPILSTQMKSVGEVMSIGRTFKEAMQKALRSLEIGIYGLEEIHLKDMEKIHPKEEKNKLRELLKKSHFQRLFHICSAIRRGVSTQEVHQLTHIDPWFLYNLKQIIDQEVEISCKRLTPKRLKKAKQYGFSDRYLAKLTGKQESDIFRMRVNQNLYPVYKRVDTCAAEFEAYTPYLYSTYEEECEAEPTDKKKIMILGGGPNRIGQGIEFDYCCVHASFALKEDGYETIMVNCNPETVSTDYDTSNRLYFEPLTLEDVLHIAKVEKPYGVIVQFGGQTPLRLALDLKSADIPILGTDPDDIDRAEDRELFKNVLNKLQFKQTENGTAFSLEEAAVIADQLGYPVVVRPSYVLGGRAMEIVYDEESLDYYMTHAVKASPEHPILIDKFLEDATEIDVDAVSDGQRVVIGGIMEHIEKAGIHSGDSACSLPPFSISPTMLEKIRTQTEALAKELNVKGLINIQFAIQKEELYILEVNPRASRTAPFVSKATGVPLAKIAARVMGGKTLKELGFTRSITPKHVSIKESVFPFVKFSNVDVLLGPEMKSTGEVMGIDKTFGEAFAKSQIATGLNIPLKGHVFISVKDTDKPEAIRIAEELHRMGFTLVATRGTASYLESLVPINAINKVKEGSPHIVESIDAGDIAMVINTTFGPQAVKDSFSMRRACITQNLPYFTTLAGATAMLEALQALQIRTLNVQSLQEYSN